IETIHQYDVNNDGWVDLILPNSHGYIERGPTWIYTQGKGPGGDWPRRELPNDSSWMSRVVDIDGDGHADLVVVNGENGVTSELDSYVYWGGPGGLTGDRAELPTAGAYDVVLVDITGNGLLDIIFPSAWVDHHNLGKPRLMHVYVQVEPRRFVDESKRYGLIGIAATGVACGDLDRDGQPELVVANYREDFEYDTDSFLYRRTADGFDVASPLRFPSHYAMQVLLADLNDDGWKEILFTGGNQIRIYWNDRGAFDPANRTDLAAEGNTTMFCRGAVRAEVADVDGDGRNELLVATAAGVEIRSQDNLERVNTVLPQPYCGWIEAVDLDGDGRLDLVTTRYQDGRNYETQSAIYWNGPGGLSAERVTWIPTTGAVGCTAGDLDGDGRPEIIINNTMRGPSQFNPDFPMYVYLGNREAKYGPSRRLELPTGGGTNTYLLADLSQNGYPDLAMTATYSLRVFPGGPDGPRPDHYIELPGRGNYFLCVLAADLNHNGWLDLIGVAYTYDETPETMANSSVIYHGSAEGFSAERSTLLPTYASGSGHLADVNNDGWLDFIYGDRRGYVMIYLGGPDGFSPQRTWKVDLPLDDLGMLAFINSADLNGDGWIDLIVPVMGHYQRRQSGFFLLYGGPDGFRPERMTFHPTDASSCSICVADVDNNGHLDLLVPAYSTQFSRELPAHIFRGDGTTFDFENPFVIPCDSSCAFMTIDMTSNGYRDVLTVCHRNDLGHQVDSLIFWNGPDGLSFDRAARIPGLGPHQASSRDFGNRRTREALEHYVSPVYALRGRRPVGIDWRADVPDKARLTFELRWAETEDGLEHAAWHGPGGANTCYDAPGAAVNGVPDHAAYIQYRAAFMSVNGCCFPRLHELTVKMANGAAIRGSAD
ncbi:MAG: VCBS repeat-containing protein, partial [Vicinamibacterales bacterium]|nr:VCBS repeat-containing protein [Vicinamibacterales bacterium]